MRSSCCRDSMLLVTVDMLSYVSGNGLLALVRIIHQSAAQNVRSPCLWEGNNIRD